MQHVRYAFSSVHANLPTTLSERIINWGLKNVKEDDVFKDFSNNFVGRENEIHVTILYGLHSESPSETQRLVQTTKQFAITLGKISIFTNDKYDVVQIRAYSEELIKLNQLLRKHVSFTDRFIIYQPHVTIAYVKKGKGWKHILSKEFENETFLVDHIVFSSKNGNKYTINLESQNNAESTPNMAV